VNLLAWLDSLSGVASSDSVAADPASRRLALARLGRAAVATVPALVAATDALAGPPRVTSITTDALNLVLRVAFAQQALLTRALDASSTSVPAADRSTIETIRTLTTDLITQISLSVSQSGDVLETPRNYDFTGGRSAAGTGPLQPTTSTDDFLGLTQELTDLLSRTLISTLAPVAGSTVFTELITQLTATVSRMAATVRLIRQRRGATAATAWISEEDAAGAPALLAGVYQGESSAVVFKLDLLQTTSQTPPIPTNVLPLPLPPRATITEAFDQPLPLATDELLPQQKVTDLITLLTY
jgi:hypothetical protein